MRLRSSRTGDLAGPGLGERSGGPLRAESAHGARVSSNDDSQPTSSNSIVESSRYALSGPVGSTVSIQRRISSSFMR